MLSGQIQTGRAIDIHVGIGIVRPGAPEGDERKLALLQERNAVVAVVDAGDDEAIHPAGVDQVSAGSVSSLESWRSP